jgi:Trk K+ transport system NAD-binding subunit
VISDETGDGSDGSDGASAPPGRAAARAAGSGGETPRVLLIGAGHLADATARALTAAGAAVKRSEEPTDREIRDALDDRVDRVVVISRLDHVALRRALVVAHVRPGLAMLVTIFDRHVAAELQDTMANVRVLSMAQIVAPALAGPCLDPGLLSLLRGPTDSGPGPDMHGVGVGVGGEGPRRVPRTWTTPGPAQRVAANLEALLRPFDSSARILVYGLVGFLAVLVVETVVTALAKGVPVVDALYVVAKVTVTVGPSPFADGSGASFKLFSAAAMLLALGFTAVLTAGLVNRLLDPRLTGIFGRSAVPRRDHVVVVGLGQVGQRLCELLRDLGVPVVAVERDPDAKNIARAKDRRLPVVIGDGADHRTLRRLSIRTARALAAVTSDDVENIAVAVAARRLHSGLHIALRAGDGDATSEVQSLFHIGVVRDVYRIAGSALAADIVGYAVREAFPYQGTMYLVGESDEINPFVLPSKTTDVAS